MRRNRWKKNRCQLLFSSFCVEAQWLLSIVWREERRVRREEGKKCKWFSDKLSIKYGNSASCPFRPIMLPMKRHASISFSDFICIWHGVCIAYAYVSPLASKMGMPCALIIYHHQNGTRVENGRAQAWAFTVESMCNRLIAIIGFDYS